MDQLFAFITSAYVQAIVHEYNINMQTTFYSAQQTNI